MKKLLSLLSVLTISGTAVPTTIAASPYQKEETIKNGDINYSQTNSLLKRNKRQGGHSIGQANYMSHRRQECDLRLYNFVKDLGVISDDTNYTILNVLKQKNAPFTNNYNVDDWTVLNKTNSSATIVTSLCPAFNNDVNGIVVNYLIKRNLDDIAFPLKIWFNEFKIWKEGINFNKKSKEDYKTEFRLRLTTLATALSTVNNRIYINQLFGRVQGLENELSNLKQKIESPDFLTSCQNIGWFASSTTIAIPGVGGLISGISASLAANCGMISEFS